MTRVCLDIPFVLGLPLDEAQSRLALQGFLVETELLEPRKPAKGNELRVISLVHTGERSIKLIYANFHTRVDAI